MKEKRSYNKPTLLAVSLRAERPVADQCWSPNSAQREHGGWYNAPGYGGCNFVITTTQPGNCGGGGTTFIVNYYIGNGGEQIPADEYYAHHPGSTEADLAQECESYVQGAWPAFKTNDPSHLDPDPPHWPWSV